MRIAGNFIWFIFGGIVMGLSWWLIGLLAFVTVVGIPWGRACFVIGNFAFFPFGREAISRKDLTNEEDIGTGTWGKISNIVWLLFAGLWLALLHVGWAVGYCITIIGIPFGLQHLKLAGISLFPVGKTIVSKEVAKVVLERNAQASVAKIRGEA